MTRLLALLLFLPNALLAQPGDLSHPLRVTIAMNGPMMPDGALNYVVTSLGDPAKPLPLTQSDERQLIMFQIPTTNGIDGTWEIEQRYAGQRMSLRITGNVEFGNTDLRIPFMQGRFRLDVAFFHKCISDQLRNAPSKDHHEPDTLACSGGRIIHTNDRLNSIIELVDLAAFAERMEHPLPDEPREASYPGGSENFNRFIDTHFNKTLIERVGVRTTLSANVVIEKNGTIHQVHLNGSPHPILDKEFKRVLQLSSWWEPAVIEDLRYANEQPVHRSIERSVVIDYEVDPARIWEEIPDEMLTLGPAPLTSTDSIEIHLRWIGGSCGQYVATTELIPQREGEDFREVILCFGAVLPAVCEDLAHQHFMHKMAPLPPGKYRLRRLPHPQIPDGAWAADPYSVKFFDVGR